MFPFWDSVIAPVIKAARAQRIVEIGALRGETTAFLLESLGPDAELHVIDPLPEFDPAEHERRFPGRYVFHRDLSLEVLPHVGAFDVALIDGDHNWYTVYNELQVLRDSARRSGRPLPALILHDVCWPYGRRDLYYEPSQIPDEFRQPYARRGMRPGRRKLLEGGGFNSGLCNAEVEGGPRNGVRTALDDFVKEHDRPLRVIEIPIYFGLAIVVEIEVLDARPELVAVLDRIESAAGKDDIIALAERIRLDAALFEHNMNRVHDARLERANRRYLELLRGALLDEHYIENELRIEYLIDCIEDHRPIDADYLRDPRSFLRKEVRRLEGARHIGHTAADGELAAQFPYTAMGEVKLAALDDALHTLRDEGISGDLVECGAGRGGGGVYLRGFLQAYEIEGPQVWVADRFRATPPDGVPARLAGGGAEHLFADLHLVREAFARFGLLDERVKFLQGPFADTLPGAATDRVALLRIGRGVGKDAAAILEHLYERVVPGGYVVVEDDSDPDCRAAVEAFRRQFAPGAPSQVVGWSGTTWRKPEVSAAPQPETIRDVGDHAPLAPPLPADAVDLSVVVVFYNMKREAERTLHSLSRSYQQGIDDLDYEVIVVENGSAPDQRLGSEYVARLGPDFRYLDLGGDATPSPTHALNEGIRASRGRSIALMIDGAHVLTPGVLRFGMAGLRTYQPAIVATQQWYVGPGQQPDIVEAGYDQAHEDELFSRIAWPADGYRLFDIGHFIGERDWFDGIPESNCVFVPRSLLEQVGGFDDSFSMPGGGYANLELWERLHASPGVTMVSILGEGSFHQVHGGTTTNEAARNDRREKIFSYARHFHELRGRGLMSHTTPIHYVGNLSVESARRTRSRRMTARDLAPRRLNSGRDGLPNEPFIVPEELKTAFVEAFWNSLAWKQVSWLGQRVNSAPADLVVYQELMASVRPDWVVVTGPGNAGRARFFASICDLLDHGRVVWIDVARKAPPPTHSRIVCVEAKPEDPGAVERVRELTGDAPRALVVIGSNGSRSVRLAFEHFSALVPIGSYVILENTIVNGHPVWPGHGPGPLEAVHRLMGAHGDFMQDTSWEKYGVTFNPGGFLRRIS